MAGKINQLCGRCLQIKGSINNKFFLIDTGTELSLLTPTAEDRSLSPDLKTFYAANDTAIPVCGTKTATISLGLRHKFAWSFIIADISVSTLGEEFSSDLIFLWI